MRVLAFFVVFLSCLCANAQTSTKQYQFALPGYKFVFPRDHGSHPPYSTEWWYYTGHLKSSSGKEFGFQATWFRTALSPSIQRKSKWATRDIYFAHFALTDVNGQRFYFSDKIGRGNLGLSGADANKSAPRVHVGDWNLQFGPRSGDTQSIRLSGASDQSATRGQKFSLRLGFRALKPPTIHGERGVSQKSAGVGRASHYYSFCRLDARGEVQLDGETFQVTGQSWFDHEFGSSQLEPEQTGWDWFSIQLNDGRELMLYHLRLTKNRVEPLSSGTLVERDGRTRHLKLSDFRLTPVSQTTTASGARYPTSWRIEVPSLGLSLVSIPALADQELRPLRSGVDLTYWEGLISLKGTSRGKAIAGRGYLELTGYKKSFAGTF
ncbi:MAG: carotenoid 1,2-hydratase [Proteobacteria bacterium]|nr:MAG: carotenoid 1,2-hydratase [Pseudomonadota bacterium]